MVKDSSEFLLEKEKVNVSALKVYINAFPRPAVEAKERRRKRASRGPTRARDTR